MAIIETPTATAIVRTAPESEDVDAPLLDSETKASLEQELLIVKAKPITASFRTTIEHLRERAGRMSRFRGLHILFFYAIAFHSLASIFTSILPRTLLVRSLIHIFVSVGLCRISLLWNHAVISEPSSKRWYRRIVNYEVGRKIALPTAMVAVAEQVAIYTPALLFKGFSLKQYTNGGAFERISANQQTTVIIKLIAVILVGCTTFFLILFPAQVMLTRVQASLLSEEEESIVPFDRSYGGKVVPAMVGGTGRLEMRDAWKTFDWNSRVRLFKIYAKVLGMQMALFGLYALVVVLELRLAVGKQMDEMIVAAARTHRA